MAGKAWLGHLVARGGVIRTEAACSHLPREQTQDRKKGWVVFPRAAL